MINRVVRDRQRTVSAFVVNLEAEIDDILLTHLHVVRDFFAVERFAPTAFAQRILGINQFAMILEQPLDAAVGAPAFLVRRKRNDDISIRLEAFLLIADQVGNPDGGLRFVVSRSAAIEKTVFLRELKRLHRPIFAFGFNHVGVREQQDRLVGTGAAIANDEIALLGNGATQKNVGIGKASGLQSSRGGFGYRSRGTGSV